MTRAGTMKPVLAPFPYFGGKAMVAANVWERFGDAQNYVEPFFGSGAVLLSRPHLPRTETVNDTDGFLVNAWRAIKCNPDSVAEYADYPVSEPDLHARHYWLVQTGAERSEHLCADPDWYDAKAAGWWIWGACSWIGSGWCSGEGPWVSDGNRLVKLPKDRSGQGINRQLPHLSHGRGINRQLPRNAISAWFQHLSERLRRTRIACGDWARVCTPSVTHRHGLTAVFLDPPYGAKDRCTVYTHDSNDLTAPVQEWCRENGDNPKMRIALCGYEGEYDLPDWDCFAWKTRGGYGSQGNRQARDNSNRERIWFSRHCLSATDAQTDLSNLQEDA